MMTLVKRFTQFVRDEEGASAIEYALMAAMVAVVVAGFLADGGISTAITNIFTSIQTALTP